MTPVDHPPDELLAAYAMDEPGGSERAAIGAHVNRCIACRAVVDEVRGALAAFDAVAGPDPGPGFEDRIWARVAPSLPAPSRRPSSGVAPVFMAMAATLAGVAIGSAWWIHRSAGSAAPPVVTAGTSTDDARQRVLFTALDTHLSQTELLLIEMLNAPDTRSLAYERAIADDLLQSARLYRATAEALDHGPLGSVLDDVQPVLIEIARAPEDVAGTDLASIRERIDAGDLLFKVRVAAQDVRDRRHDQGPSPEGAL